jgi:prepilin-type N-terminal cleavage/methylation domain-containing protein
MLSADPHHRVHSRRHGFTLLELMLALTLLGLFAALLSPLLMASARERRTAMQEQLALQLATNQLERLTLQPPEPSETAQALDVPADVARWLPGVEMTATTTAADNGQRIVVSLTWNQRTGVQHKPVTLEGWSFAEGGQP